MQQGEFELERIDGVLTLRSWSGIGPQAVVPEGVQAIGEEAFEGRRRLRNVVLPDSVRAIGMRAFQKCTGLREIVVPGGVEEIGVEAFNGCTALGRVVLKEGVCRIQARAFWHCSALTEMEFPASVTLVASRAFECCSALRHVITRNPGVQVDEYAFNETPYCDRLLRLADQCTVGCLGASPADCPEALVLPEGLTHIDHWAYSKSLIRTAWLPSSLRTIGMCAFKDCKQLREVSLSPNSYCNYHLRLEPGDGIFAGCTALEQVIFRGGLRNFTWYDAGGPELLRGCDPEKTFMGCSRLRRILAWEVPLAAIPAVWRQYAVNGFLEDLDRAKHYAPEVAAEYRAWLRNCRDQLIRRTERDPGYALIQYLIEERLLDRAAFDAVFGWVSGRAEPQTIAALLTYERTFLGRESALDRTLAELDEL